jgi:hypothetical protein
MNVEPPSRASIEDLVETVMTASEGRPIDARAVAALLEGAGVREVDAVRRYGRRGLFELGAEVYDVCRQRGAVPPAPGSSDREAQGLRRGAANFLRGGFFFVPLAIQLGALTVVGYGQWASLAFSTRQASIVAIAVIASFVATAGVVQTLGYLGPLFAENGKSHLTLRLTWRMLLVGALGALAVGGGLWGIDRATGWLPAHDADLAFAYYALMCGFWLTTGVLYMLRLYAAIVVVTVAGVAVVTVVKQRTGATIYLAHYLGLACSIALGLAWGALVLRRRARNVHGDLRLARLAPASTLATLAGSYFVYGILYYVFLFVDRLAAFSEGNQPLPIWFRLRYEVGLDAALISVVLGLALLEYTIHAFSHRVEKASAHFTYETAPAYRRDFLRFYARQAAVLVCLLALGTAACVVALDSLQSVAEIHRFTHDHISRYVYLFGTLGYALLALGLLNGVVLFSLSSPRQVMWSLVPAIAVAAVAAMILSRQVAWWYSVIGLTAGAALFAGVSTVLAVRALRRIDYYQFAAF